MKKKFCENCGQPLESDQDVCLSCGSKLEKPVEKKSKNKKVAIIVAVVVSILLVAGIALGVILKIKNDEIKKQEALQEAVKQYKEDAYLFNLSMLISLADIETVGNDISSYWKDYIYNKKYLSVDDAVQSALNKNKSLIETINKNKITIESDYKKLLSLPDENDSELIEIKAKIKELYSEYYDFYDIVITPTGNYNSFRTEFTSHDGSAIKKYDELNTLLGH